MAIETKKATDLFNRYMGYDSHPKSTQFKAIVDLLVAYMLDNKIAPDEIRDAAFVASVQFLQIRPMRQLIYERDDLNWRE